jgi:hypothetical protein
VSGHGLGVLERAAIIEISGDAGGAEGVIADCRGNAGVARTALKHAPRVGLGYRARCKNAHAPDGGARERPLAVAGEAGCLDVVLKISLEIMLAGHAVFLAAFLVQADPQTAVLPVNIRHGHAEGRAYTREGKNEKADQRPVAEADDRCGVKDL